MKLLSIMLFLAMALFCRCNWPSNRTIDSFTKLNDSIVKNTSFAVFSDIDSLYNKIAKRVDKRSPVGIAVDSICYIANCTDRYLDSLKEQLKTIISDTHNKDKMTPVYMAQHITEQNLNKHFMDLHAICKNTIVNLIGANMDGHEIDSVMKKRSIMQG